MRPTPSDVENNLSAAAVVAVFQRLVENVYLLSARKSDKIFNKDFFFSHSKYKATAASLLLQIKKASLDATE